MDRMLRPKATVLSDAAIVPEANLQKPPTRLTHELVADQPYFYMEPRAGTRPDGFFPAGTKVKLQGDGDAAMAQVVDSRGLAVVTALSGLRALPRD